MFDDTEFDRWREATADALQAARDNADAGWHNWACMISEQAAQLVVKALLHGVGRGDRARGHDLVRLLEATADAAGLTVTEQLRGAAMRLTRHYQPSRYPDALPGGTPHSRYQASDAEGALADAGLIVSAVDMAKAALLDAAREDDGS